MTNARIVLMRHAEKTGDPMDPHLSQDGYARAAKLADFIPATFGIPQFLIATSISKHSVRPIETLEPLSTKIGVSVDATYADQDLQRLGQSTIIRTTLCGCGRTDRGVLASRQHPLDGACVEGEARQLS